MCLNNHVDDIHIGDFQELTAVRIHDQDKDGVSVVVVHDGFVVGVTPEILRACLNTGFCGGEFWGQPNKKNQQLLQGEMVTLVCCLSRL